MRRRRFLSLAALSLAPLAARGAEPARRIAWLVPSPAPYFALLKSSLARLGHVEGRDVIFDERYTDSGSAALRSQVVEAIRAGAQIIVTSGTQATLAAKAATTTVPIIGLNVSDPVALGMVKTLARPEANLTGVSIRGDQLAAKKMEAFAALAPMKRIGMLYNPDNEGNVYSVAKNKEMILSLGLTPVYLAVRSDAELDQALMDAIKQRLDGVSVALAAVLNRNFARIAQFTLGNRLPSAGSQRRFVEAGGLMTFGQDYASIMDVGAIYIDKILKGARIRDLPFQQADKPEFGINLKTARALGITVPRETAARADFVIE